MAALPKLDLTFESKETKSPSAFTFVQPRELPRHLIF
jgi:hypothetical protein